MFSKAYWNDRAKQFGHTGHSEPFYYCFDQEARLYAIEETLKKINGTRNKALDFGCGSGDFVELLALHYQRVWGYDFADVIVGQTAKRFSSTNINIIDSLKNLSGGSYNLILSVTVFQVIEKDELDGTMKRLCQLLSNDGAIVSLDLFSSAELNAKFQENKTTEAEWLEILNNNNLAIVDTIGFYNPVAQSSRSWHKYNHNPMLRILRLFKRKEFAQKIFKRAARKLIAKHNDVLPLEGQSKINIIRKKPQKQ